MKKVRKKLFCRSNVTPFMSKSFQIWDHFFPSLFPKDSEYQSFYKLQTCRCKSAQNFQEPVQNLYFWTQNRKNRYLKKKIGQILKNSFNFYMFLGHFEPISLRKIFSKKICLPKKYTFRRSAEYLRSLDIGLWEVGAKKPLNWVRKCNGQTEKKQKNADIFTYRMHHPEGQCLEVVEKLISSFWNKEINAKFLKNHLSLFLHKPKIYLKY